MALSPKDILGTAFGVGRRAASVGLEVARRLRRDERDADVVTPASPAPEAVGAPRPGRAAGPKSPTTKRASSRGSASKAAAAGKRARPATAPSGGKASGTKRAPAAKKPVAEPAAESRKAGAATKAPEAAPAAASKPAASREEAPTTRGAGSASRARKTAPPTPPAK